MDDSIDNHVLRKYEIHEVVGSGAYGIVWKIENKETGKILALKKIIKAFNNEKDAVRTLREVTILEQLRGLPHIVTIYEVIQAVNNNDIYLIFEYVKSDLSVFLKEEKLDKEKIPQIVYQLLLALRDLHCRGLIHRDLKPSNILVDDQYQIKLADFGLARPARNSVVDESLMAMTDYVATRWYRSPEVLLGMNEYSEAVDVWALGCIMAELYLGSVLFRGSSTMEQLNLITGLLGMPSKATLKSFKCPEVYSPIRYTTPIESSELYKNLESIMPPEGFDLMLHLLDFSPIKRYSVGRALIHPYFKDVPGYLPTYQDISKGPLFLIFVAGLSLLRSRLKLPVHSYSR
uniref:Extracellular signal-regulated kinase 2-like n=1 Tax=Dermatophagoides pteronyssinus TaxID=6956 RepID=A0A6P6Y9J0_DERPT|nr:extracellular signal-regulated kinase 2-like [Dermatophagoides pteronyssinus]